MFSCFNSELSAVGTTLSEQKDKGDQSEDPSPPPSFLNPLTSVKGMAEYESALCPRSERESGGHQAEAPQWAVAQNLVMGPCLPKGLSDAPVSW